LDDEAERACGTARRSFIARPGNPVVHKGQNNLGLLWKVRTKNI
jgi:hypothetical protein